MLTITTVHTAHSVYQIDWAEKKVRRLSSTHAPTDNQKDDGEWQDYESIVVGPSGMSIQWAQGTTPKPYTITSPIQETYDTPKEA